MNICFKKDLCLIDGNGKEWQFKAQKRYNVPDYWAYNLIEQGYAFEYSYTSILEASAYYPKNLKAYETEMADAWIINRTPIKVYSTPRASFVAVGGSEECIKCNLSYSQNGEEKK